MNINEEGGVMNSVFEYRMFDCNKNVLIGITGQTGCQPKGSKVLMANGEWKEIQDIKLGDEILSPQQDGTYIYGKIIDTFKFFSNKIYEVRELNRQHNSLYLCSSNHIIPLNNMNKKGEWALKEYEAQELFQLKESSHNRTVPMMYKLDKFKDQNNCAIEPYTLGVYIGDGHFSKNGLLISNSSSEVLEEVSKHYPIRHISKRKAKTIPYSIQWQYQLNGELGTLLKEYGLKDIKSGEKFIPKQALLSDSIYREKLLAGLIDTDGYLSKSCSYSYCTKSKQLAENITFLVHSLGGRARINKITKKIKKLNFIGNYYNVSFYLGDTLLPIKVPKKRRLDNSFTYLSANRKAIKLIEKEGQEVYGFTVNTPSHYYITDNYTITKNSGKSYASLRMAEVWYQKKFKTSFPIENVCFSIEELMERLIKAPLKRGDILILEEAGTSMGSLDFQNKVSKLFNYVLQTFRSRNISIILNLPYFSMLNKTTRMLLHMRIQTLSIDKENKLCILRPYYLQINQNTGKQYQHYPKFIIDGSQEKINKISFAMPSKDLIDRYEKKKFAFVMDVSKDVLEEIQRKKTVKPLTPLQEEILKEIQNNPGQIQRDIAIKLNINPMILSQNLSYMRNKGVLVDKYIEKHGFKALKPNPNG